MHQSMLPIRWLAFGLLVLYCLEMAWTQAPQDAINKPFLHPLFSEHAVLQRDTLVPIWGWATPGTQVAVEIQDTRMTTVAGDDGKWLVKVGPLKVGGPYPLTVTGPQMVTRKDVLVGDVWLCSGQSNMELGVNAVTNSGEEVAGADFPQIRLFNVTKHISAVPVDVPNSEWMVCTPENVSRDGWMGFSAVAFFFGRQLHKDLGIPIGIIHSSWAGTTAELWVSQDSLKTMTDFKDAITELPARLAARAEYHTQYQQQMTEWWATNDPGITAKYAQPAFDDSTWRTLQVPGVWEFAGLPSFDGIAWLRKTVELPAAWEGKDLILRLGAIDDNSSTWFNGVKVGETNDYMAPCDYVIPGKLVKTGQNVIAVRDLDTGVIGGIHGMPPSWLRLEIVGQAMSSISLAGEWKMLDVLPNAKAASSPPQREDNNPDFVTVLYNGMIAPLVPFPIKGTIWYQGEQNAARYQQYRTLLPTLIKDWRTRFGSEFTFLIVQLANYQQPSPQPTDPMWARMRETQRYLGQTVPGCGTAVTIDIGEAEDIHPKNKQEVGRRLALIAEGITYGKPIEYYGPLYHTMKNEGTAFRLYFTHLGGGLVAKESANGILTGFSIAGEDGKFVWADAVIDGDTVVVSSPLVAKPVAVRYAWANNPLCNLYNKAGLPASPFRTDDLPQQ